MYAIPLRNREIVECAWWDNVFSDEELDKLQEKALSSSLKGVVGKATVDTSIRRSTVEWLTPEEKWSWVFEKLARVAVKVNDQYYDFNLKGFANGIQLANYKATDSGTYGWHQDFGGLEGARKLSMVLQLSDPTKYEGGELQLLTQKNSTSIPKKRGLITIFPSWTLHQVTPVTKGVRQSLVAWVLGPSFR